MNPKETQHIRLDEPLGSIHCKEPEEDLQLDHDSRDRHHAEMELTLVSHPCS